MVNCADCQKEFEDKETLYECNDCEDIFCVECKEKHNCLADDYGEDVTNEYICIECGGCEEEMMKCSCGDFYCDSCFEEHKKECSKKNTEFNDYETEEYIKEKVAENL